MAARMKLVHTGDHEDILVTRGMRGADDTFFPGLQEVGRLFGVTIECLPESGFALEYTVQPPIPAERVQAFAELVTAIGVDSLHTPSYPNVIFAYQQNHNVAHSQIVTDSLALISS